MKNTTPILLAGLIAGCLATSALAAPQDAAPPQPVPQLQPAQPDTNAPAATQTNAAPALASNPNADLTAGTADQGLTLNLRGVSVDKALNYLADSAGFTIVRNAQTSMAGNVDVVSTKPLNKEEIIALFNKVLADHNLTVNQDRNILTVESLEAAYGDSNTKVVTMTNPTDIPRDAQVVTEVIPVHSLNPTQVVKDLYTLIPRGAQMNTSEAGNAILMTGTQADIRRFAQIIAAIDSTGNGDLQVFLLTYADSKSIAQELKDVFTSQDTTPGINPFAMFGRGGRGGGGATGNADESSKRAAVHVNAVSDDENNAVLVSAPADFMPGISNIIKQLDIPQEDSVIIRRFKLVNADCNDVASELTAVFPDPNLQANQNTGGRGQRATFAGNFGGGRAGFGGGGNTPGGGMSDRMKKQVTVNTVADPRTQSVLVTASKDTMNQIERIIEEMDADPAGHQGVFVYTPTYADVLDMQTAMQDLFMTSGRSSSTSTTQNALLMRMQSGAQAQSSSMSSSSSTFGSSSSGGVGSTTLR
ncbi:MAG: secretin N-terminal domain-containing protein [Verrucomicrobiota bacterium]